MFKRMKEILHKERLEAARSFKLPEDRILGVSSNLIVVVGDHDMMHWIRVGTIVIMQGELEVQKNENKLTVSLSLKK